VANRNPKIQNLNRAGKGQPPKGLQYTNLGLTPELRQLLDELCRQQSWKLNYLIEQSLRVFYDLPADYDADDLDSIKKGQGSRSIKGKRGLLGEQQQKD
jgi:hypothetical protein